MTIFPKTKLATWAMWLFFISIGTSFFGTIFGNNSIDPISRLITTLVFGVLSLGFGSIAFIFAIVSVIKYKELPLVFLPLLLISVLLSLNALVLQAL